MEETATRDADGNDRAALHREARAWVARLTSGEATDADAWALAVWRARSPTHEAAFAEAARLWRLAGPASALARAAERRAPSHPGRRALGGLAVAACAAGLFLGGAELDLWPSPAELAATHRTGAGERATVALPDGSTAELNARTSLVLRFSPAERLVELVGGEAVFTVRPDPARSFVVATAGGRTAAIGTVFGVREMADGARVLCLKGRVRVALAAASAEIGPGEAVAYGDGALGAAAADLSSATAWRRGLLVFRDTPLAEVAMELNRHRAGRLILADGAPGARRVSGLFHLDRPEEVLAHLERTLGLRVTRLPAGLALLR